MGVFDTFNGTEEKVPEAQVTYTGDQPYFDYQEGFVTDNEDDLQRRLGNRQIQYVISPPMHRLCELLAFRGSPQSSKSIWTPPMAPQKPGGVGKATRSLLQRHTSDVLEYYQCQVSF